MVILYCRHHKQQRRRPKLLLHPFYFTMLQLLLLIVVVTLLLLALPQASSFSAAIPTPSTASKTDKTVVVYGIGQCPELTLLTSKLLCKEKFKTYCICNSDKVYASNNLMYGEEYAKMVKEGEGTSNNLKDGGGDDDAVNRVKLIYDGTSIQTALQQATSIVFVGHTTPIDISAMSMLLETAIEKESEEEDENEDVSKTKAVELFQPLSKIVYVSTMGVTNRGKGGIGGFFGGGGSGGGANAEILKSESYLRDLVAKNKDMDLTIIRAGQLKGGGPGPNHRNPEHIQGVDDWGLSKRYYNSILNGVEARVTMAHDKYTLGLKSSMSKEGKDGDGSSITNTAVTKGDTITMPNSFQLMQTKTSTFDPLPYESNRIVVATGIVACLTGGDFNKKKTNDNNVLEFSIGSASGKQPPTLDEWYDVLENL